MSTRKLFVANKGASGSSNNLNTLNSTNSRSVSDLSTASNTNYGPKDLQSVTLERNGSMPNINVVGNSPVNTVTKLRFEYDKYLSSLEAKYVLQKIEKSVISNINEQKKVFIEEFNILHEQLSTLSEELKKKKKLKIEKEDLQKKIELLEMLNKNVVFDESDEEILSLFTSTASKVIVKNFKKMDEADVKVVNGLLNDIMESLKPLDYEEKLNSHTRLKDLLFKVAMLTKELDAKKLICEELFEKAENLQNYNSSMKILKAQFGENPDPKLLPTKRNLLEDIKKEFDKN